MFKIINNLRSQVQDDHKQYFTLIDNNILQTLTQGICDVFHRYLRNPLSPHQLGIELSQMSIAEVPTSPQPSTSRVLPSTSTPSTSSTHDFKTTFKASRRSLFKDDVHWKRNQNKGIPVDDVDSDTYTD